MFSPQSVERLLRERLPAELHQDLAALIELFALGAEGRLSQEELQQRCARHPQLARLLRALAGQSLSLGKSLVSIGQGGSVGDVTVGPVVERDHYDLNFQTADQLNNLTLFVVLPPERDQASPAPPAAPQAAPRSRGAASKGGVWMVPHGRSPLFTGRDDDLKALRRQLTQGRAVAVSGMPGIGKTQVAVHYAHKHRSAYDHILWVRADTAESLRSGYLAIAAALGLPHLDVLDAERIVERVYSWLVEHRRWLLIVDNLDELSLLDPLLRAGPGLAGHVLVTTRLAATSPLAAKVELRPLGSEASADLLLRRAGLLSPRGGEAGPQERERARAIATLMDGLPLALHQVGAYIEETGCGLDGYLAIYKAHGARLLGERGDYASDYPDPIAAVINLSLIQLRARSPEAAELLLFCALLHPDQIPIELLVADGPGPLPPGMYELNRSLREVLKFSLLRRDGRLLSIHRVVQQVLRARLGDERQGWRLLLAVHQLNGRFPESLDPRHWAQSEELLPHVAECAGLAPANGPLPIKLALLMRKAADYLTLRARYGDAQRLYERVTGQLEPEGEAATSELITALNKLAELLEVQGLYGEGEAAARRALELHRATFAVETVETARAEYLLALIAEGRSDLEAARRGYDRALVVYRAVLGEENHLVADCYNALAKLFYLLGRYAEAEGRCRQALELRLRLFGEQHPDIAQSHNMLGMVEEAQGCDAEAAAAYASAIAIWESLFGEVHPELAYGYNNLGMLYASQGRLEQAFPLVEQALAIWREMYRGEHPITATGINNLGWLYLLKGMPERAEGLLREAVAIWRGSYGLGSRQLARGLQNLAQWAMVVGRPGEAEGYCEEVLSLLERSTWVAVPELCRCLNDLGRAYLQQRKVAQALGVNERALGLLADVEGAPVALQVQILNDLGLASFIDGAVEPALGYLRRAVALGEGAFGPGHPHAERPRTNLRLIEEQIGESGL